MHERMVTREQATELLHRCQQIWQETLEDAVEAVAPQVASRDAVEIERVLTVVLAEACDLADERVRELFAGLR